jgi:hypothetical protein
MENVVETLSEMIGIDRAEARLSLLVVLEAMKEVLSENDAWALADELPPGLGYLLQPVRRDEMAPTGERETVPRQHVSTICGVLAALGPDRLASLIADEIPDRIARYLGAGSRDEPAPSLTSRPTMRSLPTMPADTRALWAVGSVPVLH